MAAFPPPHHELHPSPLLHFFLWLHSTYAVDPRQQFNARMATATMTEAVAALREFEQMLTAVINHRGSIGLTVPTQRKAWQTPHDCLTAFKHMRSAIAMCFRMLDEPHFFNPAWKTETVVALRDGIVADRAFDRLPILADALEEAGCDNRFILDHLRGDDDHSHMCWVLDLLCVGDGKPVA